MIHFIFSLNVPNIFLDKSISKYFKVLGSYLMPSANHFIFYGFTPRSLADKFRLKRYKLMGNYFNKFNPINFITDVSSTKILYGTLIFKDYIFLGSIFIPYEIY